MVRITVDLQRRPDLDTFVKGQPFFLHRLWVRIRFSQPSGWSQDHSAILDTGASYSILPRSLWRALSVEPICAAPLHGIVPGNQAQTGAILATVRAQVFDAERNSSPLILGAMLAKVDHLPLLLGWAGCLERAKLVVDAPHGEAWLEL